MNNHKRNSIIAILCIIMGLITFAAAPVVIFSHYRQSDNESKCNILSHDMLTALNDIKSDAEISSRFISNDVLLKDVIYEEKSLSTDQFDLIISDYINSLADTLNSENIFIITCSSNEYYTNSGSSKILDINNPEDSWYFEFLNSDINEDTVYQGDISTMNITVLNKIYDSQNKLLGVCGAKSNTDSFEKLFTEYKQKYDIDATFLTEDELVELKELSVSMTDDYINQIKTNEEDGSIFTDETGFYTISTYCPDLNVYFTLHGVSSGNKSMQRILVHDALALALFWVGAIIFINDEKVRQGENIQNYNH